jgi:hypothetical protein
MLLFAPMLLPLVGIVLGAAIFSVLGSIVLQRVPGFRFSTANLVLFVVGAFVGTASSAIAYGRIFGDSNGFLTSTRTAVGLFIGMFVGAVLGGSLLVWLSLHFRKQPQPTSTISARHNSSTPD